MTAPQPTTITVTAGTASVYLAWGDSNYLVLPPAQARTLAAELLTNADRAEGALPATVYQVDRR